MINENLISKKMQLLIESGFFGSNDKYFYHGSNVKFDKFDMAWFGKTDDGYYGRGFYFFDVCSEANDYGKYVYKVKLNVNNPLTLPYDSSMESPYLLKAREILSEIYPEAKGLKPNYEIPKGFYLKEVETRYGNKAYAVYPKPELYDTDLELYFDESPSKEYAIVQANDTLAEVDWDAGWLSDLLKKLGRDELTDRLNSKGYDCLIIESVSGSINEYIVWDPNKIQIVDILTDCE